MKIIAFGASVTKQDRAHKTGEIRGYIPNLRTRLEELSPAISLRAIGLGSSLFSTGGYALLPFVLRQEPDILILEWHSTGEEAFDSTLWQSAILQIRKSGIHALLAILPKKDVVLSKRRLPSIDQAYQYQSDTIHVLDLYGEEGSDIDVETDLRDNVHTTALGGKKYAEIIFRALLPLIDSVSSHRVDPFTLVYDQSRGQSLVAPIPVNSALMFLDYTECREFCLLLHCTATGPIRIILDQKIGPFSPVISIVLNNKLISSESLWDKWCHYERQCYSQIAYLETLQGNTTHILTVSISMVNPEYHLCNKSIEWPESADRYIKPRKIYCVGNALPRILQLSEA